MPLHEDIARSAATIRTRAPQRTPRLGIVLGSGWQGVVDHVDEAVAIAYSDLPAFPLVGVAGHAGQLILGRLGGAYAPRPRPARRLAGEAFCLRRPEQPQRLQARGRCGDGAISGTPA